MELYHNNISVCAQKVRLVLCEKGLKPVEHHMMLFNGDARTPEYLKLNPKGVVPTLIDRGEAIIESTVICEYLEDAYPQHSLRPEDPLARAKMRQWTLLPDAALHQATGVVSIAIALRHLMANDTGRQLSAPADARRPGGPIGDVVEKGVDSAYFMPAFTLYDQAVEKMAKALSQSPWLAGESYSLADVAMLPYICRLEDLSLSWMWDGARAAVGHWLARAKARSNFSAIADYLVPDYIQLFSEHGQRATPRLKDMVSRAA